MCVVWVFVCGLGVCVVRRGIFGMGSLSDWWLLIWCVDLGVVDVQEGVAGMVVCVVEVLL